MIHSLWVISNCTLTYSKYEVFVWRVRIQCRLKSLLIQISNSNNNQTWVPKRPIQPWPSSSSCAKSSQPSPPKWQSKLPPIQEEKLMHKQIGGEWAQACQHDPQGNPGHECWWFFVATWAGARRNHGSVFKTGRVPEIQHRSEEGRDERSQV